jgi:pimeloyl-ACP methyl ester carboxylesterase
MTEPTIVLVHGAFADASSWRPVFDELQSEGHTVVAPPNPLQGIGSDAAYVRSFIENLDAPVLLVGHSYGGAVITVAGESPTAVGLVYVAGFAPDEGESLGALQGRFPDSCATPYLRPAPLPDGGVEITIDTAGFHEVFAADVSAEQAAFMAIAQRPLPAAAFGEPAGAAGWRTTPSWAVIPTEDGAINPDVHRFSYERAGATTIEAQGASHVVMISRPNVVADVIRQALEAVAESQRVSAVA